MFFTLEKLERSTKKLKDLRYRERIEIPAFDASTPEEEPVGKRPESVVYTGTLKKGDFWTGRGTYMWIRQTVEIPAEGPRNLCKSQDFHSGSQQFRQSFFFFR